MRDVPLPMPIGVNAVAALMWVVVPAVIVGLAVGGIIPWNRCCRWLFSVDASADAISCPTRLVRKVRRTTGYRARSLIRQS